MSYAADDAREPAADGSRCWWPVCTRRRQLSINIWRPRPSSAANPPHSLPLSSTERTDSRADGRTLDRFNTLTACYADRVIKRNCRERVAIGWVAHRAATWTGCGGGSCVRASPASRCLQAASCTCCSASPADERTSTQPRDSFTEQLCSSPSDREKNKQTNYTVSQKNKTPNSCA